MRAVVMEAIERFGRIDGVIHATGAAGAGLIQLKTAGMADEVLAPRLIGATVLERLTRDLPLDFFVVFSSLTAIAGGVGQVDTCAAGAFLDAFAHLRSSESDCFTGTINWSPFQWETWNLPPLPGGDVNMSQIRSALQASGIGPAAAAEAFDRVLSAGHTQTLVCPHDLERVLEQTDAMTVPKLRESIARTRPGGAHRRGELAVAYEAPRNPTEETVAEVWGESFGIEAVGIHDNFFELAGNSLLAIQIVTRLRLTLQIELPMTSLFESPTVAGLAERIENLRAGSGDNDMEALLTEVEKLSPAEAEELLHLESGS